MARINIEEEAWKRIYRLANFAGCSVREALGTVGCLWGDSQEIVKTHGTKAEILNWANLLKISDEETEKWISSLENARFISLEKNGLYKIHGNDIQIESRAKHASKSSKGGKALKKKLLELKRLKADHGSATGTPEAGHRGLNALQCITKQSITKQDKASKPKSARGVRDRFLITKTKDLESAIPETSRQAWEKLYPREFIAREIVKAVEWISRNPKKNNRTSRGWAQFLAGWLERNWPRYQQSIPSERGSNVNGVDMTL
jgi:hypothetical protein